jgi:hypothetical protein
LNNLVKQSKCKITQENAEFIDRIISNIKTLTLLYRGSKHGWNACDFHTRCDKKGPTICLFQIKDGDCIGGYTKVNWSSKYTAKSDDASILFNVETQNFY